MSTRQRETALSNEQSVCEKRALSPASWFSRNGQPNARPAVNLNVWPPTKNDISWEWEVFLKRFFAFQNDSR